MSPVQKKRLLLVTFLFVGISSMIGLALYALNNNVNLFYTPTEVKTGMVPEEQTVRLGGMVVEGSFKRGEGLQVVFDVTDFGETVTIEYTGILPDLFREGQGIVTEGKLSSNKQFIATQVLAKHDENYMPPEVKASLREAS